MLKHHTTNKNPNYRACGAAVEVLKLVFWQTVSLDVVYVALWMVCSESGLSWLNIQSSFNLAMKHGITHGLCVIAWGGGGYINHTPVNSDAFDAIRTGTLSALPIHQDDDEGRRLTITQLTLSLSCIAEDTDGTFFCNDQSTSIFLHHRN